MSAKAERAIRKVFERGILPLSEACRNDDPGVMDLELEPGLDTYYQTPSVRKMSKADFETGGAKNLDTLESALRELWKQEHHPEYAALAKQIARLARSVRTTDELSAELSQFVYVMY